MRLLHLTHELPRWPGGTGGATRQFHLLRRLAELGHEVTVIAPVPAGEEPRLEQAGIRLAGPRRPRSRVAETLRAIGREPALAARAAPLPVLAWQVAVLWNAMRPYAQRALEDRPDVVSVEHDNAAGWVAELPPGTPAVLTLHNLGWRLYESRAAAASGARGAWFRWEAARFRRLDGRWLDRYAGLVAVSGADAERVRALSSTRVHVVPNGVASEELAPLPPSDEPATLLFTGTLNHPPNAEGIVWFVEEVWPRVREARPDARLLVVGRAPPREVGELGAVEGVEVVGPVPEMAPYFSRATAVVVPLLSGGGTRLKILEALACRRAVVSTSVGREGLELRDGEELLEANGAERFAEATVRLLEDPPQRERLAAAGRAVVERRYDWRVLGDELERVLEEVA